MNTKSKELFTVAGIRVAACLFVLAGTCSLGPAAESSATGEVRGQVSNAATGA